MKVNLKILPDKHGWIDDPKQHIWIMVKKFKISNPSFAKELKYYSSYSRKIDRTILGVRIKN